MNIQVSKTDIKEAIRLMRLATVFYRKHSISPADDNRARLISNLSDKLARKLVQETSKVLESNDIKIRKT